MKKVLSKIFSVVLFAVAAGMMCFAGGEADPGQCAPGEWKCSDDAYTLMQCSGEGAWKTTGCMTAEGKLCENNACVEPWRFGSPAWPAAAMNKLDTKESLKEKAEYYEDLSSRLFVNPKLKYMTRAWLPCKPVECTPGQNPPCQDCTEPAIPEEKATWQDVERFEHHDNDGLFSALYLAAEAFRYGVTKDPEALKMIKLLLEGEMIRTRITGIPGLYTRSYVPPGVKGVKCPEYPGQFVHTVQEGENQWVIVGEDGCARIFDDKKKEWKTTEHCVSKEFAGWCWVDNVSKDEYSGHMFAYGAIAKLVDDPEVQATVRQLISEIAKHYIKNKLEVRDWDGRVTSYGNIHTATFFDYHGLNAAMALDFMTIAGDVTKDPEILKWKDECLLQKKGNRRCLNSILETPKSYLSYLKNNGIYLGPDGCLMNYDNNSMHMLSMHNLIWFEHDPVLREAYQKSLDEDVFRPKDQKRAFIHHNSVFFDFVFASQKKLGPRSDGPAYEVVRNGIEMLNQFPARYRYEDTTVPPEKAKPFCKSRFEEDLSEFARTPGERCPNNVMFWDDPYRMYSCEKNHRILTPPTDYLLPYWMGRYYGFITDKM